jgi:anti-sigma regulatory factor (Ser/Thr protein kinase)
MPADRGLQAKPHEDWEVLDEFDLPSEPGIERQAAERVMTAVRGLGLQALRLEQLHTAVAETVLNAIEHGNEYQRERPVLIRVLASPGILTVHVTDQGDGREVAKRETPDLAAKLAGQQSVRGWGFYLIEHMVDEVRTTTSADHHTVELFLYLEGENDVAEPSHGGRPSC